MLRDNLHFKWGPTFTFNKPWNFAIGERESGKTTDSWWQVWSAFHYEGRPSVVLRRRTADITTAYIEDAEKVLNKFLEEPIQLLYMKGDINKGIVDVRIAPQSAGEIGWQRFKNYPLFVRIISLSTPMSRIKSLFIENLRFIFIDEFICNLKAGERYLSGDEYFLVEEIYTTYNREAKSPIKIIACGNPYSVYCPYFTGLGVDTNLLKPGSYIVGPNYVIDCFQVPPELKEKILAANPMYQFDDAYNRYAFGGQAINDANIKLQKREPQNFKLQFILKVGNSYISLHHLRGRNSVTQKEKYWCCLHKADWLDKISKNRKIYVLNFDDMSAGTIMFDGYIRETLIGFKSAMNKQDITFNCIDAKYIAQDLYNLV